VSRTRLNVITLGILLSLFLASVEGTVVATAMPTIVAQLGGLSIYSWVFSVYLLTSTTTVPIYGKLSDLYGRKLVYLVSMLLFLTGSVLCGQARTMDQLILFRAVQGLGAGGVLPLAFTIIGELFSLEQRARMQGLLSGVWGVSSIIGPLIGGFLVDQVSWNWVFYINVIPGLLALACVWFAWKELGLDPARRPVVDYLGAILLTLGVLSLLIGLEELGSPLAWVFLGAAGCLFVGLIFAERSAVDPILPIHLFRGRLFSVAILHAVLSGAALFGSISYVPLFVQAVLHTNATQAGITLTPMSLGWTLASILAARLLLKTGYRSLVLVGMVILVAGMFLMSLIGVHSSQLQVMVYLAMAGIGMGLSVPAFLIAVQSTVRRADLGTGTSTLTFSRSMGGTIGVSVLGIFLGSRLAGLLVSAGIDPNTVSLDSLLDPLASASAAMGGPLREALAISIANMFLIGFVAALLGLLVVLFAPPGKILELQQEQAADQPSEL